MHEGTKNTALDQEGTHLDLVATSLLVDPPRGQEPMLVEHIELSSHFRET